MFRPAQVRPSAQQNDGVDVKSKWAFKRLVDELSSDQYKQMISALRESGTPMPGWTDRLAPDPARELPAEAVRILVPLNDLVRALTLARTARRGDYYNDPKGGVWLVASQGQVRVCGSDDYAAAFMDLSATVDVPGTVVADARDIWQIVEALRKGTPPRQRSATYVTLETEGEKHIRIGVNDRSHRATLLPRHVIAPPLPPSPRSLVAVADSAAFRRAVLHVVPVAGYDAWRQTDRKDLDCVGLRAADGVLTLDACHQYHAAQANLAVSPDDRIEALVHYLWLRQMSAATLGPVQIGQIADIGEHGLFVACGERWAAWTSHVRPWRERFVPMPLADGTTVTFQRDDVHRHLIDAKRLAEASWAGGNSTLVEVTVSDGAMSVASLTDPASAHTGVLHVPAEVEATGMTQRVPIRIGTFLTLLQTFAKQEVSLHFGDETVIYATTPGYRPEQRPPKLAAVPRATAAEFELL